MRQVRGFLENLTGNKVGQKSPDKSVLAGVGLLCIWAYCFEVVLTG